ncbi:MAG: queuosine salvage family protein [Patescibacteria group bacterium]|nr:queuosine salvage family protein [Patescibacteria group bacterium]
MNEILETTKFVADNSKQVFLDHSRIIEFAGNFRRGAASHWLSASPVGYAHLTNQQKLDLLLVFNSISFSYWGDPKWTIEYKGGRYDGSWAMIICIIRAIDEKIPILDAQFRSSMSREDFRKFLRGNIEIPLFEERWNITKEIGGGLLKGYGGNFANFIKSAGGDGLRLLKLIIKTFPSFDDVAQYGGRPVYFYKRAQLLVEDIYQAFGGEGYGSLKNMDQFTACADYKLPQSLRRLGIMKYAESLSGKIDNKIPLPSGSEEEVEIRANTIWAVEFIKQALQNDGQNATSIGVNDHLWLMGQDKQNNHQPYHRTRTTAY